MGCSSQSSKKGDDDSEKIKEVAMSYVDSFVNGNYDKAMENFDENMSKQVNSDSLKQIWDSLTIQYGSFKKYSYEESKDIKDATQIIIKADFEKNSISFIVPVDKENKIIGFFLDEYKSSTNTSKKDLGEFDKEVTIKTGEYKLPGILTMPGNDKDYPVVVLVHGSGPCDMDESIGSLKPFKDIADGLKEKGIATLRFDKRTFAEAEKVKKDEANLTLKKESVDDTLSAISLLESTKNIDENKIYVLGHSQGGLAIPMINSLDTKAAGFIMLAAPARNLEDILLEQVNYILSNTEDISNDEKNNKIKEIENEVNKVKELYKTGISDSDYIAGIPKSFWISLGEYDQVAESDKITRPTLILQGERDYQVTMQDYKIWEEKLGNKKNIKMKSYKNLNHLFIEGSKKSTPEEYSNKGNVSMEVIEDIATWISQ